MLRNSYTQRLSKILQTSIARNLGKNLESYMGCQQKELKADSNPCFCKAAKEEVAGSSGF